MKKKYEKPMIVFENFTLSTNIAGDCKIIIDSPSEGNCGYTSDFDEVIFTSSILACEVKEDDGEYNKICYHVPIDNNNLFNS